MSKQKFETSKESGIHQQLNILVGEWEGITKTWFEPDKLGDESPMRGTMKAVLDGRFILHEYEGSLADKPFKGIAIYGCQLTDNRFQAAWIDSFHMGTGIMFSQSEPAKNKFSVLGNYSDPGGGPPWGWRTEIEPISKNKLVITAYNISPGGEEAKATETIYLRKSIKPERL